MLDINARVVHFCSATRPEISPPLTPVHDGNVGVGRDALVERLHGPRAALVEAEDAPKMSASCILDRHQSNSDFLPLPPLPPLQV